MQGKIRDFEKPPSYCAQQHEQQQWQKMKSQAYSHEVRPVSVNEGAQGQAALPGHGEVRDSDILVSLRLPLAPAQQLTGSSDGFWNCRLDVTRLNCFQHGKKSACGRRSVTPAEWSNGLVQGGWNRRPLSFIVRGFNIHVSSNWRPTVRVYWCRQGGGCTQEVRKRCRTQREHLL